jgi:deoxyadenosine/deoxycytidine kinase
MWVRQISIVEIGKVDHVVHDDDDDVSTFVLVPRDPLMERYFWPAGFKWLWCPPVQLFTDHEDGSTTVKPMRQVCAYECCDLTVQEHEELMGKPDGRPFTIEIIGNIGAGKSSLTRRLSEDYPHTQCLDEGIDEWRKVPVPGGGTVNLLQLFYSNPKKHSLAFQTEVMLTKARQHNKPCPYGKIKILERSLDSARHVFVEALRAEGNLADWEMAVLDGLYHQLRSTPQTKIDLYVYLETSAVVCLDRIKKRGRPEEKKISLAYLNRLAALHETFIEKQTGKVPVLRVNGNDTSSSVFSSFFEQIHPLDRRFSHWFAPDLKRQRPVNPETGCRCEDGNHCSVM